MGLSKRIYTAFLASVGLWCLAIVMTPLLHVLGSGVGASIANVFYLGFARICHQLDERSLHLFGAKFGVCIRCTSIYFSFLAGLIVYPYARSLRSTTIPARRWLLLAIAPMVLDALLNDVGILQSAEISRVATGCIAGFTFSFYILPPFISAITQLSVHCKSQGESHYAGQTQ